METLSPDREPSGSSVPLVAAALNGVMVLLMYINWQVLHQARFTDPADVALITVLATGGALALVLGGWRLASMGWAKWGATLCSLAALIMLVCVMMIQARLVTAYELNGYTRQSQTLSILVIDTYYFAALVALADFIAALRLRAAVALWIGCLPILVVFVFLVISVATGGLYLGTIAL